MRIIKFRAWDYENEIIFKPILTPFGEDSYTFYKDIEAYKNDIYEVYTNNSFNSVSLM